ncbi:class I SAM-dependent methyltransferase [bacterium]|nr:class I SAM-dependent methyltransferase [candidate division CSSED10-310 bacterium]
MSIVFRSPRHAIDLAVERLKTDGIVHPDAAFNPDAPGDLRREVAYYDRDFLFRLGRCGLEEEIVDDALRMLQTRGLVTSGASYDKPVFLKYRNLVREQFTVDWTSLSPVMEQLLYMLTSVRRPDHLVELGSFCGYTLSMFAGPCTGPHASYRAERIIGIDIDPEATRTATANFAKLGQTDNVNLIAEDARTALQRIPGPFDFVYIEAKSDTEAGMYLTLLKQFYDRLAPGAWVIAHDSLDWTFMGEIAEYLAFVRDSAHFSQSISFEIDPCGLELSIR